MASAWAGASSLFVYSQGWGNLYRDSEVIGTGYSGHGDGLNDPAYEAVHDVGPIPAGLYRMTEYREDDPHTGKGTIVLEPEPGTDTHGRGGFRIHGDNAAGNRSASHGCIVIGNAAFRKEKMWNTGDRLLSVVLNHTAVLRSVT